MIKHIFTLLSGFIFMLLLSSCNKDNTFTLGQDLVDAKTNIIMTDTTTIRFYTFREDSIISSNFAKALVGSYNDYDPNTGVNLGLITASSYFEVGLPTTIPDFSRSYPIYDSTTLALHYSHYVYGDTTQPYTIIAHRLTTRLEDRRYSNGYFYNTSNVLNLYDETENLGSKSKKLKPSRRDSIQIKLSDDLLGNDLFTKIVHKDIVSTSAEKFLQYFRGFALVSGNSNSCVMGFNVADTSMYMRIHYHIGDVKSFLTFGVTNTSYQFNHISSNRKLNGNTLDSASIAKQLKKVPSSKTNHQTYCQAGTGLMTRLEFPYLKKLLETSTNTSNPNPNIKILKAELVLCPVRGTYNLIPLPPSLNLYQLDNLNTIEGTLLNSQGNGALTPYLNIDYAYGENTQYIFDVTSFVASALQQQTTNVIPTLGVSLPTSDSNNTNYTTLNRVVLGDGSRQLNVSKLRITFWRY